MAGHGDHNEQFSTQNSQFGLLDEDICNLMGAGFTDMESVANSSAAALVSTGLFSTEKASMIIAMAKHNMQMADLPGQNATADDFKFAVPQPPGPPGPPGLPGHPRSGASRTSQSTPRPDSQDVQPGDYIATSENASPIDGANDQRSFERTVFECSTLTNRAAASDAKEMDNAWQRQFHKMKSIETLMHNLDKFENEMRNQKEAMLARFDHASRLAKGLSVAQEKKGEGQNQGHSLAQGQETALPPGNFGAGTSKDAGLNKDFSKKNLP